MPELGGRGLYEQMAIVGHQLRDRFIVITGWDDGDAEFFRTTTSVPVLRKPFPLATLSEAIRTVVPPDPERQG